MASGCGSPNIATHLVLASSRCATPFDQPWRRRLLGISVAPQVGRIFNQVVRDNTAGGGLVSPCGGQPSPTPPIIMSTCCCCVSGTLLRGVGVALFVVSRRGLRYNA